MIGLGEWLDRWIERKELVAVVGLTIVYGVIAFARLGDTSAPQSFWDQRVWREETQQSVEQQPVWVDFGEVVEIGSLMAYMGAREGQSFALFSSYNGEYWDYAGSFDMYSVFAWHRFELEASGRFLNIVATSDRLMLGGLEFRNTQGVRINPQEYAASGEHLFDEAATVPAYPSFMNSTIFDEIYHPRTAFEFVNGLDVYEDTHPPLGKSLIGLGIRMFGMTPFGWRFMGTLFGVIMVPLMYVLAKEVFENKAAAFVAAGLFAFDFMHFVQTRLATIDTYVTFFVILMYLCMYKYYKPSLNETDFNRDCLWLGFAGLFMGLAIASKWQGVYAGAGLALLWLIAMIRRYSEYKGLSGDGARNMAAHNKKGQMVSYHTYAANTVCKCFVFFIIVPVLVYVLSYIEYIAAPGKYGIGSIIDNQMRMFTYHAWLEAEHPFASPWWEWPLNLRPLFAYQRWPGYGIAAGISSFGNPVVWWGGVVGMVYAFGRLFDKNRPRLVPVFIVVSFAAQYLPWVFVGRITFIYHFFVSVPFITLALVYLITETLDKDRPHIKYAVLALGILLFAAFYPVLAGVPVPAGYVETFLRWFRTWQLI